VRGGGSERASGAAGAAANDRDGHATSTADLVVHAVGSKDELRLFAGSRRRAGRCRRLRRQQAERGRRRRLAWRPRLCHPEFICGLKEDHDWMSLELRRWPGPAVVVDGVSSGPAGLAVRLDTGCTSVTANGSVGGQPYKRGVAG